MTTAVPDPSAALEQVLDEERACLLEGRYEALESINARKISLLDDLGRRPAAAHGAARIHARARDNQKLAAAAAAGLGAAMRRVSEVQRLDGGTGHYDDRGARVSTAQARRTLRRV